MKKLHVRDIEGNLLYTITPPVWFSATVQGQTFELAVHKLHLAEGACWQISEPNSGCYVLKFATFKVKNRNPTNRQVLERAAHHFKELVDKHGEARVRSVLSFAAAKGYV